MKVHIGEGSPNISDQSIKSKTHRIPTASSVYIDIFVLCTTVWEKLAFPGKADDMEDETSMQHETVIALLLPYVLLSR